MIKLEKLSNLLELVVVNLGSNSSRLIENKARRKGRRFCLSKKKCDLFSIRKERRISQSLDTWVRGEVN
jgi:hypothetical protein